MSLNLDLTVSPEPASTSRNQALQTGIEEIYNACSRDPSNPNSSSDAGQSLRRRWKRCEPLRKVNLFAIEPLARVLGDATLYFGEREDFVFGAVVTCFLALNTDPIKTPMPFGPSRLKGLLVLANILSHTGPISGSNVSSSDKSLRGRVAQALSKMDQATIAQAILGIVVYWSRVAHAEGWHVYQEASAQLKDLESLPGRKKERELVQIWLKDQDDVEAAMFFDYAVMRPLRDLAGFTLDVMDSAFGTE